MSVFIQKLNPITGANDWVVQQEDYDYHQEVASASFADMLHDTERNQLYERALKLAIDQMHTCGKKANVLDIGTGTGLLSMMAARHGADKIVACEAFKPMSDCALKVLERNGLRNRIRIIPKRSTDLTVGPQGDLDEKCNILVTEVFDTELIGEGALTTFSHAHEVLLEPDCIVVPHSATVFAQVVESPFVQNWNKIKDIYSIEGDLLIRIPPGVKNCTGSAAVHDLQLSQIGLDKFKTILKPTPVFQFDWSGRSPLIFDRSTTTRARAEHSGLAQAVFMWWELQMDPAAEIILSCAPFWAHPKSEHDHKVVLPWRDHWMQAIYYLPQEVTVEQGKELSLISCHDEFSLWYSLKVNQENADLDHLKPICHCGVHVAFSRTRIGQVNDTKRNKKYLGILEENVDSDSVILILSDGFYLSLAAAKLGAKKVYYVETNHLSRKILIDFINDNCIDNVEVFENIEGLLTKDLSTNKINFVLGEPYFLNSILPWDNFMFIYLLKGVKFLLTDDVKVFPNAAVIKAVAVHFTDLNKIRQPLRDCEGFAMKDFDDLIEASSNISDDNVEAQPLWEYPGIALSKVTEIVRIDSLNFPENMLETTGQFDIQEGLGGCNGIALWVEWVHGQELSRIITSGPTAPPETGKVIEWDIHTRQGVSLFATKDVKQINYCFKFDFHEGNISFKCV